MQEVAALLHDYFMTHTSPAVDRFLTQRGLHPTSPMRAFLMLQSMAENERSQRCSTLVLSNLRSVLHEDPSHRVKRNTA